MRQGAELLLPLKHAIRTNYWSFLESQACAVAAFEFILGSGGALSG